MCLMLATCDNTQQGAQQRPNAAIVNGHDDVIARVMVFSLFLSLSSVTASDLEPPFFSTKTRIASPPHCAQSLLDTSRPRVLEFR